MMRVWEEARWSCHDIIVKENDMYVEKKGRERESRWERNVSEQEKKKGSDPDNKARAPFMRSRYSCITVAFESIHELMGKK